MTMRSFVVSLVSALIGAAALLVLATLLDVPALRYLALVFLFGSFIIRELWKADGDWVQALMVPALLVTLVAVVALVQWLG